MAINTNTKSEFDAVVGVGDISWSNQSFKRDHKDIFIKGLKDILNHGQSDKIIRIKAHSIHFNEVGDSLLIRARFQKANSVPLVIVKGSQLDTDLMVRFMTQCFEVIPPKKQRAPKANQQNNR